MYLMRYGHRIAPGRRRPWRAGSWPGTRRPSHPSCACRWPRRGDRDAGRTASASPAGQRNPLRAAPGSECALKYNCPFPPDDLPWTYDDMADAETSRVPKPALAARGCPGRSRGWSGCGVSAKRHLPATAPGKAPRGGFRLLRDEPADRQPVPKTGQMRVQLLPSLRASCTGLVIDTSIA